MPARAGGRGGARAGTAEPVSWTRMYGSIYVDVRVTTCINYQPRMGRLVEESNREIEKPNRESEKPTNRETEKPNR